MTIGCSNLGVAGISRPAPVVVTRPAKLHVMVALLTAACIVLTTTSSAAADDVASRTAPAAAPAAAPAPVPASTPAPIQAVAAASQPLLANPTWNALSALQRQTLSPLVTVWDTLDESHKSKWLEISRRHAKMTPAEQARMQERMRAWVALTPDQRRVAREVYTRAKKLNNDQKSAQWQQYQQLPDEQKRKLAAEADRSKVATLPPANSKARVVPPLKSAEKQALQQSVRPQTGGVRPGAVALPGLPAAQTVQSPQAAPVAQPAPAPAAAAVTPATIASSPGPAVPRVPAPATAPDGPK